MRKGYGFASTVILNDTECRFIAVHMEAIDHCQTTRSILRNEADNAGIPKDRLLIPADGETIKP